MSTRNQSDRKTIRNLTIFSILVLASGWIGWGLDRLMGNTSAESPGMAVWISMPLILSLLLRTFGGDGWKDFGIKPNLKGNWFWYLFSILIFPVVTSLVVIIGSAAGWIQSPNFSADTPALILQAFAIGLVPQFFKNILEEAPWRGYLAPKINSLHINDYLGHIIVGLIWGAWHIPYYLFFLDRATLSTFSTLSPAVYACLAIWVMITWAFVYGEIRLLTNSFWPAVLMHMVEDAFLVAIIAGNHIQIKPGMDWLISPMNGVAMSLLFVAIGVGLNQYRKRRSQAGTKEAIRVISETA